MSGMIAQLIPAIVSAVGSLSNSGGASSGGASPGGTSPGNAPLGAVSSGVASLIDTIFSNVKDEFDTKKQTKQLGETFEREIGRHQYSTLLDPAYLGQQNASGSNAPLDKALGSDARKVAGASEGGATPQLQNNVKQDLVGVTRKPTEEQLKIAKASPWYQRGRDMMTMLFNG